MVSTLYVDTSALAKLIVDEAESVALRDVIRGRRLVSSTTAATQLLRVGLRLGEAHVVADQAVLEGVHLLALTGARVRRAGLVEPTSLRSLDALHLVSALDLGEEVSAFVAYNTRLIEAAQQHGLTTLSPV